MDQKLQNQSDLTIPDEMVSSFIWIIQEFLHELQAEGISLEQLPEVLFAETIGDITCVISCKKPEKYSKPFLN